MKHNLSSDGQHFLEADDAALSDADTVIPHRPFPSYCQDRLLMRKDRNRIRLGSVVRLNEVLPIKEDGLCCMWHAAVACLVRPQ